MTVGIAGLGLIGGSLAKAYKSAGHTIYGFDRDASVLGIAQLSGAVDGALDNHTIGTCDVIFIAVYPSTTLTASRLCSGKRLRIDRAASNVMSVKNASILPAAMVSLLWAADGRHAQFRVQIQQSDVIQRRGHDFSTPILRRYHAY